MIVTFDCAHAQQKYEYIDLNPPFGAPNSTALGINQAGIVVGYILDSATYYDLPIVWSGHTYNILPLPPGYFNGSALDINDSGVVCGEVWIHDSGTPLAFRYANNTYTLLPTLSKQIAEGIGERLNNSGDIVGLSYTTNSPGYRLAILWKDTTLINLGTLGGSSFATDINDSGLIAGFYYRPNTFPGSFIYRNNTMIDLGSIPGYDYAQANGMNSQGWIVGNASGASGQGAFLWRPDSGMTLLTVPAGYLKATATAINDSGVIAGRAFVTSPPGTVHPVIWKDGVMTDLNQFLPSGVSFGDMSDINNAGQIVGYVYGPLKRAFMLNPPHLVVTSPTSLEVVLASDQYTIQWQAPGIDSLKIELSLDSGKTFNIVINSVPAGANKYQWNVPDTLSAKCRIRISDVLDATKNAQSAQFRIKPYVLARFNSNGDYEQFLPWIHGWRFQNSRNNMWPESWWNQFDYANGSDPYTARRYPPAFTNPRDLDANNYDFPDWPLFVRAFGINQCYRDLSAVQPYSPRAATYWHSNKSSWGGSCFGFSISSLLAFDFPSAFAAFFPDVPSYSELYELSLTDTTRRVINQLWQSCMGAPYVQNSEQKWHTDVRQTLQELKKMFLSEIRNDQSLYMIELGGAHAHSVVPIELKRIPNTSKFNLTVYDNNCPGGDCGGGILNPAVVIDSAFDTWYYPPQRWGSGIGNQGLYLEPPVGTFLLPPTFPRTSPMMRPKPFPARTQSTGSYVEVFNTTHASISITDSAGDTIGFHDSTAVNTFADGIPIVPATSNFQPPIGYYIPANKYSIQMSSYQDTLSEFSVFSATNVFSYRRTDAANNQSDRLTFNNGIDFGNPDPQTKLVNLEAIVTLDSTERDYQIMNCAIGTNDSVRILTPDSARFALVNLGPQKTYDLNILLAGGSGSGQFTHSSITVPAHSTHFIVPNWQDIQHQPVKIYVDSGNTGTIHDSVVVTNQTTGVKGQVLQGTPREFTLDQNYPNPFNPVTIIHYELPKESQVMLRVYNILGQEVATLVNEMEQPGYKSVSFDARSLPSGVYFYRLNAGSFTDIKKMLLIK
ncbi:MAG: T9SS type A sorting domain-containing protein [Bacteroidota bacterium]